MRKFGCDWLKRKSREPEPNACLGLASIEFADAQICRYTAAHSSSQPAPPGEAASQEHH
jgi:hypothetical protein